MRGDQIHTDSHTGIEESGKDCKDGHRVWDAGRDATPVVDGDGVRDPVIGMGEQDTTERREKGFSASHSRIERTGDARCTALVIIQQT